MQRDAHAFCGKIIIIVECRRGAAEWPLWGRGVRPGPWEDYDKPTQSRYAGRV